MERQTEYDIYATRLGIIDSDIFISNLANLSETDEDAKKLYKKLLEMQNNFVNIQKGLSYEQFIIDMNAYYNCFNFTSIYSIYHIFLDKFNGIQDKTVNLSNIEPARRYIYSIYKQDYTKFIGVINEWISDTTKWGSIFAVKKVNNATNLESKQIPNVPKVPNL